MMPMSQNMIHEMALNAYYRNSTNPDVNRENFACPMKFLGQKFNCIMYNLRQHLCSSLRHKSFFQPEQSRLVLSFEAIFFV